MDNVQLGLEGCADPFYHPVRGAYFPELTSTPTKIRTRPYPRVVSLRFASGNFLERLLFDSPRYPV